MFHKPTPFDFNEKLAKRVGTIPKADLPMWIESTTLNLHRTFDGYVRHKSDTLLAEAVSGAEALHYMLAELQRRSAVK